MSATIVEYRQAVIALFQSGKATPKQWGEMSQAVLTASEGETNDRVPEIDTQILGSPQLCTLCGEMHHRGEEPCPCGGTPLATVEVGP